MIVRHTTTARINIGEINVAEVLKCLIEIEETLNCQGWEQSEYSFRINNRNYALNITDAVDPPRTPYLSRARQIIEDKTKGDHL